jgi:serine/threonine-protein kinase
MADQPGTAAGAVIADRYRLEMEVASGPQGVLWRASDLLAGDAPVALRQLGPGLDQAGARAGWSRLQALLHPQVPRFGETIQRDGQLWLVREWQDGRTYQELLEARRGRQLVFGPGEVLLLLRQLLPVLAVLHGQEICHGDLTPANLLRRDRDGLPVLLDIGWTGPGQAAAGATPGYAPPEQVAGAPLLPWMDLHGLGVVALVLLSGEDPAALLDPVSLAWRWPDGLRLDPPFRAALERLISADPAARFTSTPQALAAFQALPMPESTGPVARADRTLMLVPPPAGAAAEDPEPAEQAAASSPAASSAAAAAAAAATFTAAPAPAAPAPAAEPRVVERRPPPPPMPPLSRQQQKEEAVEGRLLPVVVALVVSAVVGITAGWWLLGRGDAPADRQAEQPRELTASLPPGEVDQRQQLLNRLRALQINRSWFLRLVDANLLAQFPERGGRLPNDSIEDAPLRKVWNALAEEWLARVEQLPPPLRRRLGSFSTADWDARQRQLAAQGVSPPVLRQLVSGNAQALLPGRAGADVPAEPFRQLWYAAGEQTLETLQIEPIQATAGEVKALSASLGAGGARLFPIRLPAGYRLVLGVNGSPLMQMSVYNAAGSLLEPKGPLRVVTLPPVPGTEVQLLVTNDGVAPAMITLSLRADAPPPEPPQPPPTDPGTTAPPPAEPVTPPTIPSQPPVAPSAPTAPPPVTPDTPATP